jgi:rhamnosyltransferase
MHDQSVCAVLVTYHPTSAMVENISNILSQTHGLVVVDNGSDPNEMKLIYKASEPLGFHIIRNSQNLGIASALNQGIAWAKSKGYSWVILFDQDSKITAGFVAQLFFDLQSHPNRDRIGSMHPKYIDPETRHEPRVWRAKDGGPIVSITSGALMPTWIFDKLGGFAEEYFIDEVDTEYCYRIRAGGYLIADSRTAVLLHHAGHPKGISFLGFSFSPTNHSSTRRYYMVRNQIMVYRKYFRVFPLWILQLMNIRMREIVKCFLAEQNRARKFRALLLGIRDGVIGKMGKREEM